MILARLLLRRYLGYSQNFTSKKEVSKFPVIGMYTPEMMAIASIKSFHFGSKYEANEGRIQPKVNTIDAIIAQCLFKLLKYKFLGVPYMLQFLLSIVPLMVQKFRTRKLRLQRCRFG